MFEARVDRPYSDGGRLVAGAAISDQDRRISGLIGQRNPPGAEPPASFSPFSDSLERLAASLYLDYDWRMDPRTQLLLGVRGSVADDMSPVWRPRLSCRRALGPDTTLVLLSWPLLSDDVAEVSPVEQWALADPLSPLDLARGGFSQSHEVQYERLVAGHSLVRVGVFQRDLRNLLVDLENPALAAGATPVVVSAGRLRGVKLELERRLGRDFSGGLTLTYLDSRNKGTGRDLPYQPDATGTLRMDYLGASGWRGAVALEYVGRRYADLAATTRLGSTSLWHLSLAKQQSVHSDLFLTVLNAFDTEPGYWRGYPATGRRVSGGVEYRF
jgi:hypothetical protein